MSYYRLEFVIWRWVFPWSSKKASSSIAGKSCWQLSTQWLSTSFECCVVQRAFQENKKLRTDIHGHSVGARAKIKPQRVDVQTFMLWVGCHESSCDTPVLGWPWPNLDTRPSAFGHCYRPAHTHLCWTLISNPLRNKRYLKFYNVERHAYATLQTYKSRDTQEIIHKQVSKAQVLNLNTNLASSQCLPG